MKAIRGRASFLGDRSIGHMDPGARSSALIIAAISDVLERRMSDMNGNVGIVIVSHSADVARGTADMVRQMVGDEVPLACCGGNPDGGLGTSVEAIMKAIDQAWSERASRSWSISAAPRPTARWRSRCSRAERQAPHRRLQRADRRRRGDGGDRSLGRRLARRREADRRGAVAGMSGERDERMSMTNAERLGEPFCSPTPSACTRGRR